jgi:hypothetical protein
MSAQQTCAVACISVRPLQHSKGNEEAPALIGAVATTDRAVNEQACSPERMLMTKFSFTHWGGVFRVPRVWGAIHCFRSGRAVPLCCGLEQWRDDVLYASSWGWLHL